MAFVLRDDINELVEEAIVLNLSDAIADKAIVIRKTRRIKLPGAIIAATCVVHNLVLVTLNTVDFQNIKGLKTSGPDHIAKQA